MMITRVFVRAAAVVMAIALFGSAPAHAQAGEVRGIVRDSSSGRPVAGAVVLALDALGATLGRTISGERGQYRLTRPEATMLVRAVRLGFRPTTERLPLVRAEVMTVDLTLVNVPRTLEAMDVTAARGCPSRADRTDAYALLDQARAGLLATIVARERQPAKLHVLRYERYLDLDGIEVERQIVRMDSSRNATTSFNAVHDAIDFVDRGFRAGTPGQYTYFGPDADVLLDERFQRGYCFSLAAADTARATQVGLRFTAANRRDGRVDIDGTLWIDTAARSLRDIDFRYVGVEALAEAFNAGGRVGFRTLNNGVPFIDQWSLRLVGAPDTMVTDAGVSSQIYAVREIGGELARAQWPEGATWNGPLSALHVTAVTRSGEPAAGATLNLLGTDYRVTTDKTGRATFEYILPGPYTVVVDDPRLTTLALQIPTGRTLTARRASSALVRVEVPTAEDFVGAMCDRDAPKPDEAWLLSRVVASDGRPVTGARWRVSEADGSRWRVVSDNGLTGSNGLVAVCRGLARGTSAEVASWRDPKEAVRVQRMLEDPLTVVRVALPTHAPVVAAIRRPVASGPTVTVAGSVKDSVTGALVPDARVTFLGTPFEGATDSSGTFVVGGVARGEYTVEVSTPWLDSIGAVSRASVTVSEKPSPLVLFVPSLAAILSATCGSPDVSAFIIGRVSAKGTALPAGLRVVAEWSDIADSTRVPPDSRAPRVAWMQTPLEANGTFRLCGVPAGMRLALRTESDSISAWASQPSTVQLSAERRFARADLQLDSTVVAYASFSGTVISDTTGVPIENAEVTITDIGRTVLTNRRGGFRVSDIPLGAHVVSVKRVGYAPMMTTIDFAVNRAVDQRVLLTRATTLATFTVGADGIPAAFEERRKAGIGRYLGREELDKQRGRRLGDVLTQVSGFGAASQAAGHAWVVGKRAPTHLLPNSQTSTGPNAKSIGCGSATAATKDLLGAPPPCTFSMDDLRNQGYYCPTPSDQAQGIRACACFAQVYLDDRLLNTSRPTEPFDANSIPVEDIAGVEFYASAASTPGRYSSPNAVCGVMLVWTRRR
ncbi:MAG: carboxypeptidase regulatory-like domain-containing protein [Gemmatimonadaceae bacterium]|nr:carboxypeptidase regulatory-like domain-containing protein [Gemmatimonadaceae bacterium]